MLIFRGVPGYHGLNHAWGTFSVWNWTSVTHVVPRSNQLIVVFTGGDGQSTRSGCTGSQLASHCTGYCNQPTESNLWTRNGQRVIGDHWCPSVLPRADKLVTFFLKEERSFLPLESLWAHAGHQTALCLWSFQQNMWELQALAINSACIGALMPPMWQLWLNSRVSAKSHITHLFYWSHSRPRSGSPVYLSPANGTRRSPL